MGNPILKIGVLGDGGWGTTMALHLSNLNHQVIVWGKFEENIQQIQKEKMNQKFLPEISLPETIQWTSSFQKFFKNLDFVIMAVPAKFVRGICQEMKNDYPENLPILSLTKGVENKTHLRMSQILEQLLPTNFVAVLSGPSHAEEVARGIPTSVVIASKDEALSQHFQFHLVSPLFRVYTSNDLIGVELGGALKNVIAIASGICDGLGFGSNTKSALITRGLSEMTRLGIAMGANEETFAGLSGMGDLITTCVSGFGRNRWLGEQLAKGKKLDDILASTPMVAEGVYTAQSAWELAQKYSIEMPIASGVYEVLYQGKPLSEAVQELLERDPKSEKKSHYDG